MPVGQADIYLRGDYKDCRMELRWNVITNTGRAKKTKVTNTNILYQEEQQKPGRWWVNAQRISSEKPERAWRIKWARKQRTTQDGPVRQWQQHNTMVPVEQTDRQTDDHHELDKLNTGGHLQLCSLKVTRIVKVGRLVRDQWHNSEW